MTCHGSGLMRAVGLREYGGPDVLEIITMPVPAPGPGEVVVRVGAATVNPTDLLFRSGRQAATVAASAPPYVPGMELAGKLHALGDDVADRFPRLKLGQIVMGIVDPRRAAGGAQAEYVALPAGSVTPTSIQDLAEAATVPMNGLTALMAIEALEGSPGQVVLITGAVGAVGGYAIEIARAADLHVVADGMTVDEALLFELGAAEVVPRGEGMAAAVAERYPDGVDAVIDAARLGRLATSLVRAGGTAVLLRQGDAQDPRLRSCVVSVSTRAEDMAALQRLADLVDAGMLTPRVAERLPMDRAADAHRIVEQGGLRGRVVLEFLMD